jgi:hypothetical protein
LIAPEAGEAGGGAKLKNSCALRSRSRQCPVIVLFGGRSIADSIQQIASLRAGLILVGKTAPVVLAAAWASPSICRLFCLKATPMRKESYPQEIALS